jgi:hypothetical protein
MMSLLFSVSGLFTISSFERKGSGGFFIARLQRLGIPFVVASLFIAPLAFRGVIQVKLTNCPQAIFVPELVCQRPMHKEMTCGYTTG